MRITRVILSMAVLVEHSIADICDFVQNACLVRVDHSIHNDSETLAKSSNDALVEIFSTALGVPAGIEVDLFQPLKIYGHTYHTLATQVKGTQESGPVEIAYLTTVAHMQASVHIVNHGVELASRVALMNMLVSRALSFPVSEESRKTAFLKAVEVAKSESNLNLMKAKGMNLNGLVRSMRESGYGESFAYILGPACIFALSEMLVNTQAYTLAMAKVRMALLDLAASIELDGSESVEGRLAFLRETIGKLAVMDFHPLDITDAVRILESFGLYEFNALAEKANSEMEKKFSLLTSTSVKIQPDVLMALFVRSPMNVRLLFRYSADLTLHQNELARASRVALVNIFLRQAWAATDDVQSRTNAFNLASYLIDKEVDVDLASIALHDLVPALNRCNATHKERLLLAFLMIALTEAVVGDSQSHGPYSLAVRSMSFKLQSLMNQQRGVFKNVTVDKREALPTISGKLIGLGNSLIRQAIERSDWIETFARDGQGRVIGELYSMISEK